MEKECKWFQVCPMKRFYEQGRIDKRLVEQYCNGNWKECKRYEAVEGGMLCPDNLLPDGKVDENLSE